MGKKKESENVNKKNHQLTLNEFLNSSVSQEDHIENIQNDMDSQSNIDNNKTIGKMKDRGKLWPDIVKPLPNEVLSSWMTRSALESLAGLDQLVKYAGIKPYLFDYDVEYNSLLTRYFAEKSSISEEELKSMSFYNEIQAFNDFLAKYVNIMQVYKKICYTPWSPRGKNGIRYCAMCLKNDQEPYFRKQWRYSHYTICPIHQCLLEDRCPSCNSLIIFYKIPWDSKIYLCHKCGFDLRNQVPKFITNLDDTHKIYLHFLMQQGENLKSIYILNTIVWFLANFCTLLDPIFEYHEYVRKKVNLELWHKFGRGIAKLGLFSNIELSYVYYRTASQLVALENLLIPFFINYYINSKLWKNSGAFSCPMEKCGFFTLNLSDFFFHLIDHTDNNSLREWFLNLKHRKTSDYQDLQQYINENYFHCEFCRKAFAFESDLKNHLSHHDSDHNFTCRFCNMEFEIRENLLQHLKSHIDKFPYICDECGRGFLNKRSLQVHKKWRLHYTESTDE